MSPTARDELLDWGSYEAVSDKASLVGRKLLIMRYEFQESDYAEDRGFVTVWTVTEDQRRVRFSDGSAGVYEQLRDLARRDVKRKPLVAHRGLQASTYPTCPACGKPLRAQQVCRCGYAGHERGQATTYRLDTTPREAP